MIQSEKLPNFSITSMSASLIKEKQRLEKLSANLEKELENYESLSETTYPYQLWRKIPQRNLKIQELKPNFYYETIELFEEYFLPDELLFREMNLKSDKDSVQSVKLRILNNLKDSTSLIALNEGNANEIAGVLVLVEVHRNFFSRTMSSEDLVEGDCYKNYVHLTSQLYDDLDIYTMFGCYSFLRIYALCIKPSYRHIGLGMKLFETAVLVAQSLKIPVIVGIFTDFCQQVLAKRIGMQVIKRIKYSEWKDSFDQEIFSNLEHDQKSCSLMIGKVPPPPPPLPIETTELVHILKPKDKKKKKKTKKKK